MVPEAWAAPVGCGGALRKPSSAVAAVFDPGTLSLTGWWRTNYAASPWVSTASVGTSGGRNASEATNPPTVGGAINGLNPAAFNGTNQLLTTTIESTLFSAGAGTVSILYFAVSPPAASGAISTDPALLAGAGAYVQCAVNSTGPGCSVFDTAQRQVQLTATSSAWHLVQMKWDGVNLRARVDSSAWSSVACTGMGDLTSAVRFGVNNALAVWFSGRTAEVMTAAVTVSDADADNIKSYTNARYALAL